MQQKYFIEVHFYLLWNQGPMTAVIYCLWCLKNHLSCNFGEENTKLPLNHVVEVRRRSKPMEIKRVKSLKFFRENSYYNAEKSADSAEDQQNSLVDLRLKHLLRASPVFSGMVVNIHSKL